MAPARAEPATHTFVRMVSDPYDWVGRGQGRYYHPGNATISLSGLPAYVNVTVRGGNLEDPSEFVFAAPEGRHLVEGAYENAAHASYREPHLLQRLRDGEIRRVAGVTTDREGRFKKRMRVRPGTYRAVAPRERGPDDSICERAVSPEARV